MLLLVMWVSVGECVGECECVWVGGEKIGGRKEKSEKRGGGVKTTRMRQVDLK